MNKSVPLSLIAALPFFAVNASAAEDVALKYCGPIPSLEAPGYDEETVKGQLNLEVGGLLKKVASAVFGAQAEETKKRLYQIPDIYYAQQKDKYLLRMFCASLWEDTSMSSAQRTAAITAYMSAPVPSTGLAAIPKPAEPAPKTSSYLICHGELESTCKSHPFDIHEVCSDSNGVGGANPNQTAAILCKNSNFTVRTTFPGTSGNHCGYSWFQVNCN